MRIGIYGYGNLARGVEDAIRRNPDMELAAVFTRRDPAALQLHTPGVPAVAAVQTLIDRLQDEISDLCAWRDSAIAERDFSNERAGMYRRYAESTLAAIGNCQEA